MTAFLNWLFNTAVGRALALAVVILLCWWGFSAHYKRVGYDECQAEHAEALNKANVKQAEKNAENDRTSAKVGKDAADAGAAATKKADVNTAKTKETIHDVYSKPPVTAPVAYGSCVHPVDKRVQDGIDEAVRRANGA